MQKHMQQDEAGDVLGKDTVSYDYLFKIHIIGDSGVGKSALIRGYCNGAYTENEGSVPHRIIHVDNKSIKLKIWELAADQNNQSQCLSGAPDAVLLVCDLTNRVSFDNIQQLKEKYAKDAPVASYILVGTKTDDVDNRVVQTLEFKEKAEALQCESLAFVSAKNNRKVEDLFMDTAILIKIKQNERNNKLQNSGNDRRLDKKKKQAHENTEEHKSTKKMCCVMM
jgi:GTPase SAR1 family protein